MVLVRVELITRKGEPTTNEVLSLFMKSNN